MPDFTPGGIKFPTADDKIKDGASASALADDFKGLALTADIQANSVASAAASAAISTARDYTNIAKDQAVTESKSYTDQVMDTSHLDLDTDGTPFFRLGSMTVQVHADTDGNPFFLDA